MLTTQRLRINSLNIIVMTLTNAQNGNAMGSEFAALHDQFLDEFEGDALLVKSTGLRFFCTGGDLKEQRTAKTKSDSLKIQKQIRRSLKNLYELKVPKAAVVSGDVFGGGIEYLSCFDYISSAPHCFYGMWQRKLGVTFGWGGGHRLLRRMTLSHLHQSFSVAKLFNSYEAQRMGLIDQVAPVSLAEKKAIQWLSQSARLPKKAFKKFKKKFPEDEEEMFEKLWLEEDHKKYLSHFNKFTD